MENIIYEEGNEDRVVKPKDKRLERLKKRRSQFSSSRSTVSEGSFGGSFFSETGL